jgi:hypothetical protein
MELCHDRWSQRLLTYAELVDLPEEDFGGAGLVESSYEGEEGG